ncbi:MAG: hypothetical protein WCD56_06995, partial [Pseudolabrys sp.]
VKRLTSKVKFWFLLKLVFGPVTHGASGEDQTMQRASIAAVAMIVAISLYFTLFWGYDAFRILTSPSYGLEDVWRSQFIFGIGRLFGLGPIGLIKLAAFFGTLKLAVACICAIHIADRVRCMTGGEPKSDILEAGLILVVLISIISGGSGSLVGQRRSHARTRVPASVCWPCGRALHR